MWREWNSGKACAFPEAGFEVRLQNCSIDTREDIEEAVKSPIHIHMGVQYIHTVHMEE